MCKVLLLVLISFMFTGCIVGTAVSLPFKAVGTVANTVTPDIVGDSIGFVGDTADVIIPF